MRFFSTLETKSFLIEFKAEVPSPTVNPEPPSFICVEVSWLNRPVGLLQPWALREGDIAAIFRGTYHLCLITKTPERPTSRRSLSSHTKFSDTVQSH